MTTIVYAVGGGHGHGVRGLLVGELLQNEGHSVKVVIRKGSLEGVQSLPEGIPYIELDKPDERITEEGDTLVMDTFPFGWWNEFSVNCIKSFKQKIFVARYRQDLSLDVISEIYDEIWLPYTAERNEWGYIPEKGRFIGLITKRALPRFIFEEKFILLDPEKRCSAGFISRIQAIAQDAGYHFEVKHQIEAVMKASKVLVVGAGYNTFYELQQCEIDARFIPIQKKSDDQVHRVTMSNKGIFSSDQIREWL